MAGHADHDPAGTAARGAPRVLVVEDSGLIAAWMVAPSATMTGKGAPSVTVRRLWCQAFVSPPSTVIVCPVI